MKKYYINEAVIRKTICEGIANFFKELDPNDIQEKAEEILPQIIKSPEIFKAVINYNTSVRKYFKTAYDSSGKIKVDDSHKVLLKKLIYLAKKMTKSQGQIDELSNTFKDVLGNVGDSSGLYQRMKGLKRGGIQGYVDSKKNMQARKGVGGIIDNINSMTTSKGRLDVSIYAALLNNLIDEYTPQITMYLKLTKQQKDKEYSQYGSMALLQMKKMPIWKMFLELQQVLGITDEDINNAGRDLVPNTDTNQPNVQKPTPTDDSTNPNDSQGQTDSNSNWVSSYTY